MNKLIENYLENLNEDSKKVSYDDKIIEFFQKNPNPDDDKVHAYAEELGMDPDDLEEHIYSLLTSLVNLKGGDAPDDKFDANELKMGIEVEKEHHDNPIITKAIAKGHLLEVKDYYTRLKKMEKEAGIEY